MKKIGFIGVGNMGSAMALSCIKLDNAQVMVYDVNPKMYDTLPETIEKAQNIEELMKQCELVVMSIKPQYYQSVIEEMRDFIEKKHLIITVSPSHSLEKMYQLITLDEDVMDTRSLEDIPLHLVRTMPNTPALIGKGVTAYCHDEQVSEEMLTDFKAYFESFGKLIKIPESVMPALVATTGSSPAYVYLFIEAMADAAVSFGLPRQMAYEMIAQTVAGSAEMVLQTGKHPGVLKDAVTSPAGTTIDAIIALEETGLRNSVIKGMQACYNKVQKMS